MYVTKGIDQIVPVATKNGTKEIKNVFWPKL